MRKCFVFELKIPCFSLIRFLYRKEPSTTFRLKRKAFYKGKTQSEKREETQQITCLYLNSNIQKTHRNIFLSALQNKTMFQSSSLIYVSALKFQNSELRMRIKTKPNDKQEWSEDREKRLLCWLVTSLPIYHISS